MKIIRHIPDTITSMNLLCGAVGVIEKIVFADDPFRCAEQCSARPVVANGIVPEFHFGSPGQVFNAIGFFRGERGNIAIEDDFELVSEKISRWLEEQITGK